MDLAKFFHRLFNPHCPHCLQEEHIRFVREQEIKVCKSCEILQLELERAHMTIERLTAPKPVEQVKEINEEEMKPVQTGRKFIPFRVKQQMQDAADMKTLEILQARHREMHTPDSPAPVPITEVKVTNETGTTDNEIEEMERDILNADINNG